VKKFFLKLIIKVYPTLIYKVLISYLELSIVVVVIVVVLEIQGGPGTMGSPSLLPAHMPSTGEEMYCWCSSACSHWHGWTVFISKYRVSKLYLHETNCVHIRLRITADMTLNYCSVSL